VLVGIVLSSGISEVLFVAAIVPVTTCNTVPDADNDTHAAPVSRQITLDVVSTYKLPEVEAAGRAANVPYVTVPVPPPFNKTNCPLTSGVLKNDSDPNTCII
jgi:hypothetical protein